MMHILRVLHTRKEAIEIVKSLRPPILSAKVGAVLVTQPLVVNAI
ncbi:MAG TPA: hypothetical protein VK140_16165 [Ktedonobacteraceae bacterium]|nr:hypothetical protein [Ktedonobacteraceae bacterium]